MTDRANPWPARSDSLGIGTTSSTERASFDGPEEVDEDGNLPPVLELERHFDRLAVHEAIDVPVKFVGVGEQAGDLEPFDAASYAAELMRAG